MEQQLTTETASTRAKYDRNSRWYNLLEFPMEVICYRRWRRRLFARLKGRDTLEVGIGTGKNLPYYFDGGRRTGIDLSSGMLRQAWSRARRRQVELIQGDAQELPFRSAAFDAVFGTFVFCSVPDPVLGLREIHRVLKPGGRLLLLEHVLPEKPALARLFNKLNPLTVEQLGVHINRRTGENIREAGFERVEETDLLSTIFKLFVATR